jgi:hypothetical protein
LILIPSDATDLEGFEVQQEWVDIPNLAGDYYLPVRVDLERNYLHIWGFISRKNLQKRADYDKLDKLYIVSSGDVIDDIEDIDPKEEEKQKQSIPQQKIPHQQSFMSQQKPISASVAMEAQQFAQQYYSTKPQDNQPLYPPHQQQKPTGHHYQQIESIRPQSQPQLPHYSALTQSVMAPIDHERKVIYQAFERYFMNPTFIKTNPVSDTYSLYYARVYCMLAEFRYLIAICEQDNLPTGTELKLHNLRWKSIQLRTLSKEVKAPECSYKKEHDGLFDSEIKLIKRDKTENKVMYQCTSQPLIVELLPTKKGSVHDYPDKATLETAMDTFQCVIYFE